ncbi:hypothetical protein [Paraburkholderia kururiensis]|uniref:hypothetical protein n=1 Tax=Paraburkholderia kururiensis TaxID=984307 RepID=UPI00147074CC|nr:hypothetical protein [Paraburkholderia kururiensis]
MDGGHSRDRNDNAGLHAKGGSRVHAGMETENLHVSVVAWPGARRKSGFSQSAASFVEDQQRNAQRHDETHQQFHPRLLVENRPQLAGFGTGLLSVVNEARSGAYGEYVTRLGAALQ